MLKCLEKDPEASLSVGDRTGDGFAPTGKRVFVHLALVPPTKRAPGWRVAAAIFAVCVVVASAAWMWTRFRGESSAIPVLRWEQLTNFNDSAEIPAVSPDGKTVAFLRGPGSFGNSSDAGQVWFKSLPDGEPLALTNTPLRKQTLSFFPGWKPGVLYTD